jgi:hypothetical protein
VLITVGYMGLIVYSGTIPAAGGLIGHIGGAVGFVLMLMTETLYSLRKRLRQAGSWGSMESWLRFHIFTGIVGPYLVLLHTAWKFSGLAGLVTVLTMVVVASGFIGRYIYTLVPRSTSGIEMESGDLSTQILAVEAEIKDWLNANPVVASQLPGKIVNLPVLPYNTFLLVFRRVFSNWNYRWQWWRVSRRLKGTSAVQKAGLAKLLNRRRQLYYQVATLAFVRRVLALWHVIHVPLGIALFTLAFVHVGATLYYVTFAR